MKSNDVERSCVLRLVVGHEVLNNSVESVFVPIVERFVARLVQEGERVTIALVFVLHNGARDHSLSVQLLDFLLVDRDWLVIGQLELVEVQGVGTVPIVESPRSLNYVFVRFQELLFHCHLQNQVVNRIENTYAEQLVGVEAGHLDGEENLEGGQRHIGDVGVQTLSEEQSLQIKTLRRK